MAIIGNALKTKSGVKRLFLYRAGDGSGWTSLGWRDVYAHVASPPSINYGESLMTISETSNHSGIAYYSTAINMTGYSTVKAIGNFTAVSNTNNGVFVLSALSGSYYPNTPTPCAAKSEINGNGQQTVSVDVSSLTGNYYVSFGLLRTSSTDAVFEITSVYLE